MELPKKVEIDLLISVLNFDDFNADIPPEIDTLMPCKHKVHIVEISGKKPSLQPTDRSILPKAIVKSICSKLSHNIGKTGNLKILSKKMSQKNHL